MKTESLACLLLTTCGLVQAQYGGYRYNNQGQLVDGRGQAANPHQELHDMLNPALWTTGAVAVSNTVDPNFTQATLPQIESAIAPNPEPGGQAMSRLYLTPTNPYTPGAGVQSGSPLGYNHDHYNQILIDAPASGYVATQSGAYIARTHPGSSSEIFNRGFNTYEANPKFIAAKEAAGGLGGGVVFFINQSSESFAHLRAISGSNLFMTAYVRPPSGGVITLGGQVVLNEQHNTVAALDTSQYGPAFVAGVGQIQGQTLASGNEAGFWVTGTGSSTQIAGWGDGSANSIAAAYDPGAQFHVHTHPGNSGPSYTDFLASAQLGGMPGMVASGSGNYAYGFVVEGGWLPTMDNQVVVFGECGATGMCGSDTRITVSANPVGPNKSPFAHTEIQISNGYEFSVVEGQPGYPTSSNLVYSSNGPNKGEAFSYQLTKPSDGRTMNQLARDILDAASRYENNQTYSFPNNVHFLGENEFNSNSFVSGVLSAVNTNQSDLANISYTAYLNNRTIPGFENPVPISSPQTNGTRDTGPTDRGIRDHTAAIGNWGGDGVW